MKMQRQVDTSFNPWYVGGGVKSVRSCSECPNQVGFNPWYVGGGVKSERLYIHPDGLV